MYRWILIFLMVLSVSAYAQYSTPSTGGSGSVDSVFIIDEADGDTINNIGKDIVIRESTDIDFTITADTVDISIQDTAFYPFNSGATATATDLIIIDGDDSLFFQPLFGMFRVGYVDSNATGDSVFVLFADSTEKIDTTYAGFTTYVANNGGSGDPVKIDSAGSITAVDSLVIQAGTDIVLTPQVESGFDTVTINLDQTALYPVKASPAPDQDDVLKIDTVGTDSLYFSSGSSWAWSDSSSFGPDSVLYADTSLWADTAKYKEGESVTEILDGVINPGILDAFTVADDGSALNITWSGGELYTTDDAIVTITGDSGLCSDDLVNYLYWTTGTTLTLSTTSPDSGDIAIATAYCQDGDIWFLHNELIASRLVHNIQHGLQELLPVLVAGGLIVSADGDSIDLAVASTAGEYYLDAHQQVDVGAYNTTLDAGDKIRKWYHETGSWTSHANDKIVSTNFYDDGTDTTNAIGAQNWGRSIFLVSTTEIHWIYPQESHNTEAEALAGANPNIPDGLAGFPIVGALIIKNAESDFSTATFLDIRPMVGGVASAGGAVSDHGSLAGLGDDDHPQYFLGSQFSATYVDTGDGGAGNTTIPIADSALAPDSTTVAGWGFAFPVKLIANADTITSTDTTIIFEDTTVNRYFSISDKKMNYIPFFNYEDDSTFSHTYDSVVTLGAFQEDENLFLFSDLDTLTLFGGSIVEIDVDFIVSGDVFSTAIFYSANARQDDNIQNSTDSSFVIKSYVDAKWVLTNSDSTLSWVLGSDTLVQIRHTLAGEDSVVFITSEEQLTIGQKLVVTGVLQTTDDLSIGANIIVAGTVDTVDVGALGATVGLVTNDTASWNDHVVDNSQAHTDYMLNTGDNVTGTYDFGDGDIDNVNKIDSDTIISSANATFKYITNADTARIDTANIGLATIDTASITTNLIISGDTLNDLAGTGLTEAGNKLTVDQSFSPSWTGAHDFGGATSFEFPNGDNPTVNADGEAAWENDDNLLRTYDGSANRAIPTVYRFDALIMIPDSVNAQDSPIPLVTVDVLWAPFGIKMLALSMATDVSTTDTVAFWEYASPDDGSPSLIDTVIVSAGYEQRETSITDSDIATSSYIYLDLSSATGLDWIKVAGAYYIKTGD